jgi:transcription-repair coupling factor (superfamily II helicase)
MGYLASTPVERERLRRSISRDLEKKRVMGRVMMGEVTWSVTEVVIIV